MWKFLTLKYWWIIRMSIPKMDNHYNVTYTYPVILTTPVFLHALLVYTLFSKIARPKVLYLYSEERG